MPTTAVPLIPLPSGESMPVLGQGTWYMGEDRQPPGRRGRGAAPRPRPRHDADRHRRDVRRRRAPRRLVGEAIAGRRDEVFLVSKVLPSNASRRGTSAACERSLRAARHRPARSLPAALARPGAAGGDGRGLRDLLGGGQDPSLGRQQFRPGRHGGTGRPAGRRRESQTNQVLYNLDPARHRVRPAAVVPRSAAFRSWPIRRSSRAGCCGKPALRDASPTRHGATPAQVALAWVLRQDGVIAIPKAGTLGRTCAKTAPPSTSA